MPYNPTKHHRRSIRMPGYDYTQPGVYFVTICTQDRAPILGSLESASVTLSPIGHLVDRCWCALPQHFLRVVLDALVIMPDHLHGIITIGAALNTLTPSSALLNGTRPDSLAAVIQNFKSVSTRRANQMNGTPGTSLWQRNYYERIIRTDTELAAVRQYIADNPARAVGAKHRP
ncbi:MAG: transposase [Chloroflexales bacterium]